ncbi:N-6 DNA methylase [Streptomyces nanshensis]|uniref:N-6 DNA methylase n=1 Tax=Streptomyces nanshensis TaxID=518642 RepID=UPI00085BF621|nr:N-6 DNA methylase [Streptomyces nanshensis]
MKLGHAVADTWHRHHGAGRMDIPCGVVATLALWPRKTDAASHAQDLADFIADQPASKWPPTVGEVAAVHWISRPDLINTAAPILRWYEEEHSPDTLRAIKAVSDTALRHGVLLHTGYRDPYMRSHVDLMSWTITSLRHRGDRSWLGEFHTPPEVTDLLAGMTIGDSPPKNGALHEPAGGTSGMFRSAAQHLRHRGIDPHGWAWHLQDKDPIAAAGAAVNMLIWDLGPNTLVACGDTLSEGDLSGKALATRRELEDRRDALFADVVTRRDSLRAARNLLSGGQD